MIIFLDENDVEYGALATIKATNAVNGERSLTGTIVSGDYVLSKIERGWRLRFDDEYYVVTFAKPIDEGKNVQVSFDAVHQFFWDFGKSSVYDQLSDGSHTFRAYLDFIFNDSGYRYDIESSLTVKAFEKQSFGYKNRLSLFNDIITSSGVEFQVNGKVVRILAKVGTDLSTVVRKNFNLNELGIEKNIGNFVTYQKGFGAYFDEEDHSKGRLIAEYTSPLASVYGKLEADPLVDERYKQQESLLSALKETVDNSYTISVSLDMEDLTRAGYRYTQPVAGDYIMAINETLDFQEKIRIVSFTSEYDVTGQLIKHTVTCNDIGSVKKLSASYTHTQHQAANAEVNANTAYEFANKALVSADGKNTNYYGDTFPVDNPKGTLKKGDLLFLTVGDTVKQYYWNGADWVINPVLDDVEAFKEQIAEELKDVPNREEFENKISEELANSKAEIETQIETAKTQAESNAKEYADTINQDTAKVAELANAAAGEIKADLVNVKNNLTSTSLVANNAQAAVDAAKQELAEVASELNTAKQNLTNSVAEVNTKVNSAKAELTQAKQDLTSHAQQLQTQANAQTELSKRVTSVETTANGTKTTVSELSKTVAQNGKDITSVTNRTKTVEDDLANTKTTLTQVQTTANSASQKTATLETGLNGLSAKFNSLSVGNKNYLPASRVVNRGCSNFSYSNTTKSWTMTVPASSSGFGNGITFNTKDLNILLNGGETLFFGLMIKANKACSFNYDANNALSGTGTTSNDNDDTSKRAHFPSNKSIPANVWTRVWFSYTAKANVPITENKSNFGIVNNTEPVTIEIKEVMVAKSNVPVDYQTPDADVEQKIAEYKQTADQNYASLQSNLQTLDGTVKQNKSEFDQTSSQIKSSISAVEGKIPTNVSTRNLILKSNDFANPHKQSGDETTVTSTNDYFVLKSTGYTANGYGGISWNMSISEIKAGEQFSILMPIYIDSSVPLDNGLDFAIKNHRLNSAAYDYNIPTNKKDQWFNVAITFKAYKDVVLETYPFYVFITKNGLVRIKPPMLVRGNLIPSDYQPAFDDTKSDITKLSSELTQTKDGMTLLATKTELSSAKNELQSGITTATNKANNAQNTANGNAQTISTHTTQISALNTGLSAKVSQSDFNTLSGRVTTAENNITAKANELSSKISSVEGKIPTSVSHRNLAQGTSNSWSPFVNISTNNNWCYDLATIKYGDSTGISAGTTINIFVYLSADEIVLDSSINPRFLIQGEIIDKNGNATWTNWDKYHPFYNKWSTNMASGNNYRIIKLSTKVTNDSYSNIKGFKLEVRIDGARSGKFHHRALMVTTGDVFPDSWSPAPEDAINQINAVSSELKQTKDGITLLATKTELNTAKNELQSGINTATNKANAAQNTANNNAQTINTHTTQISALNTGLQAKVSQSEFNTLSGRVTNAENNITAKANELSSKITSVEGKIPTSVGGRNLLAKTNQGKTNWSWNISSGGATLEDFYTYGVNAVKMTRKSDASVSWSYIQYSGLIRKLIEPDTKYTLSFDVYPTENVTFTATLMRGDAVGEYTDWAVMNTALANRWTKVSCVLTSKTTLPDDLSQVVYLQGMPTANWNWLVIKNIKLEEGVVSSDWSPAPEDYDSKLSTMQSEFKQTTDSIKASVQSLDNNTVKSSSLTINTDGVVIKAGKSTSDFANAVGSYFSVNQNAINLFSDNINVKGSMIVSGAITSDKIASKSINTAHLNGKIITADVISSNAVTAGAIKAGAVTTDKMSANSINGDRITAGTLDAAKIKAGSITASQIASGTITSNQIKAGGISSANIAAGAITGDKIAAGAIDANKIAANAITANMIRGGQLNSTNGATVFDLNAGTLTFNNNYGYIQRSASDKVFEITTWLHNADADSPEYLSSAFKIRKSDYSRLAGAEFTLHNTLDNKPTASAVINADALGLYDSQNRTVLSIFSKGNFGNINMQGWGDIPVAQLYNCGLIVKDIGIGGHFKSLLNIVEELCKKANIPWV